MTMRVVDTKYGKMLCRPNDQVVGRSLCYYGEYSHAETKWLTSVLRPNDVAIDVGANFGYLTLAFADAVGKSGLVYAFEPQRLVFQALAGSVALNDYRNVLAINAPVGRVSGSSLCVPDIDADAPINFGACSLVKVTQGIAVRSVTVDDYAVPACRLLKVDVEGMEMAVLDGATETIRKYHPMLWVEANSEPEAYALRDRYEPLGYRCYLHCAPLFRAENPRGYTANIWGANCQSMNVMAVHDSWALDVPKRFRPVVEEQRGKLYYEQRAA